MNTAKLESTVQAESLLREVMKAAEWENMLTGMCRGHIPIELKRKVDDYFGKDPDDDFY